MLPTNYLPNSTTLFCIARFGKAKALECRYVTIIDPNIDRTGGQR